MTNEPPGQHPKDKDKRWVTGPPFPSLIFPQHQALLHGISAVAGNTTCSCSVLSSSHCPFPKQLEGVVSAWEMWKCRLWLSLQWPESRCLPLPGPLSSGPCAVQRQYSKKLLPEANNIEVEMLIYNVSWQWSLSSCPGRHGWIFSVTWRPPESVTACLSCAEILAGVGDQ